MVILHANDFCDLSSAILKLTMIDNYKKRFVMKNTLITSTLLVMTIVLGGCQMNKTQQGTLGGAALGAGAGAIIGAGTGHAGTGAAIGAAAGAITGALVSGDEKK